MDKRQGFNSLNIQNQFVINLLSFCKNTPKDIGIDEQQITLNQNFHSQFIIYRGLVKGKQEIK